MAETLLFARYRLLEPTGMGGTAAVWRAVDESTGEEVAIKRLHPALLDDQATRVRLVREFAALRRLEHPRVVRVRDLELGRTDAALVLDYVHGPSLAVRLIDGPVPAGDALRIVSDVASALDAAHAAGILHRDVKPGNILLRDDGAALLTDFGIVGSLDDEAEITAVGAVVGTFRYMSPQRLAGAGATPADDIYALGVVAWQALAGRPPFDAPTPVGVAERIAEGPPALDGVPRAVEDAIRCAIASDPADRYPDASSFARALTAAFGVVGWTEEPPTEPGTAAMGPASLAPFAGVPGPSGPDRAVAPGGRPPSPDAAATSPKPSVGARTAGRRSPRDRWKGGLPAAAGTLLLGLAALAVLASSSHPAGDPSSPLPPVTPVPSAAPTAGGDAARSVTGDHGSGKDNGDKGKGRGKGKKHD